MSQVGSKSSHVTMSSCERRSNARLNGPDKTGHLPSKSGRDTKTYGGKSQTLSFRI